MDEMQRRVAVAKDYDMLQGLCPAISGVGLALWAGTGQSAFWIIGCLASGVAATWYQKRYGQMRVRTQRTAATVAFAVVAVVAVVIATGVDVYHPGPVLWTPLVSALALGVGEWLGLRHVGMTRWHWVSIVGLALCALLPLAGWHPGRAETLVPLAAALVVIGIVDHLRLVKALAPSTRQVDGTTHGGRR